LGQQRLDELHQVVHLLELAPRVLVELALAGEDVQLLQQRHRLARTQLGQLLLQGGRGARIRLVFRHAPIIGGAPEAQRRQSRMTSDPLRTHPYNSLTPDVVQDALAHVGLWGDGRMAALNSFENRVYQIHLETPVEGHDQVVAKFYRPGRWSDA